MRSAGAACCAASALLWSAAAFIRTPELKSHRAVSGIGAPGAERRVATAWPGFSRHATVRFSTPPKQGEAGTGGEAVQAEEEMEEDVPYPDQQEYMEMFADDELLAKYRQERQQVNDQWQFNVFTEAFAGTWSGIWMEYVPQPVPGSDVPTLKLVSVYKGRQTVEVRPAERLVGWREEQLHMASDGGVLEPVVTDEQEFAPSSFRSDNGAMAVDRSFTMSRAWGVEGGERFFDAEIWTRAGDFRTRCRFLYCSPRPAEPFAIAKMVVKKEVKGSKGPTCEEPQLFGRKGAGIYDRSSKAASDWEIPVQGGLSVTFPPSIAEGEKGAFSMDWIAGPLRYQADRLFDRPDGTLDSLQLTEIGSADSLRYTLPDPASAPTA